MAVIEPSTAIFAIIVLIICAVVLRTIYQRRRMRIPTRESPYSSTNFVRSTGLHQIAQNKLKILAAVVTLILVVIILSESVVIVQAGHRGIVLNLGAVEKRVLGEGIHFIVPFAEQVVQLEVQYVEIPSRSISSIE